MSPHARHHTLSSCHQHIFTGVHNSPERSHSWGKAVGQAGSQAGCGHCAPAPSHSMLSERSNWGKLSNKSVEVNSALFDRVKLESGYRGVGTSGGVGGGEKGDECLEAGKIPNTCLLCYYLQGLWLASVGTCLSPWLRAAERSWKCRLGRASHGAHQQQPCLSLRWPPAPNQVCGVSSLSGRFSPKPLFYFFLIFATEYACTEESWMQAALES